MTADLRSGYGFFSSAVTDRRYGKGRKAVRGCCRSGDGDIAGYHRAPRGKTGAR